MVKNVTLPLVWFHSGLDALQESYGMLHVALSLSNHLYMCVCICVRSAHVAPGPCRVSLLVHLQLE